MGQNSTPNLGVPRGLDSVLTRVVDPIDIIKNLRLARPNMVETAEQYDTIVEITKLLTQ